MLALDRYVYSKEPLWVSGASAHSIGHSSLKLSTNSSASEKYFAEEEDMPFHPSLGDGIVTSPQLLIYETFLQASHLHHSAAYTSMTEQLALSIAQASNDRSVSEYCREIAEGEGIDFHLVKESARRMSSRQRLRAMWRITPSHPGFQVDGGSLGLMNILDASLAANSLYFQVTSNKGWRVRKVFRGLTHRLFSLFKLFAWTGSRSNVAAP